MDRLGRSTPAPPPPHDMPANTYPTPGRSSTPARKNKLVNVMKRSFPPRSQRLAKDDVCHSFVTSLAYCLTIEQDAGDSGYSYFNCEERAGRVPTVEQISMGLHLSRTPHLRSTNGRGRSMSSELLTKPDVKPLNHSRPAVPPPKPALKKISSFKTAPTSATPSFTNVSTSTSTTLSSAIFQTDRQTSFAPRLFHRVTKIIPSSQSRQSRDTEPGTKPDPEMASPKKLVRFSVDEAR